MTQILSNPFIFSNLWGIFKSGIEFLYNVCSKSCQRLLFYTFHFFKPDTVLEHKDLVYSYPDLSKGDDKEHITNANSNKK